MSGFIFPFSAPFNASCFYTYLSFFLVDFDEILMKSYLRSNTYAVKKLASSYLLCIGSQSLKKLAPSDGEIFGDEIRGESTSRSLQLCMEVMRVACLSVSLSFSVSVGLCLSVSVCLSVCLSVSLSLSLCFFCHRVRFYALDGLCARCDQKTRPQIRPALLPR